MKFPPDGDGTVFSNLPNTQSASPGALAFDSAGTLYASTGGGPVLKITPDGSDSNFTGVASGYLTQSDGLAFTTDSGTPLRLIPEPAGTVLLSLGGALIAFRRSRRRTPLSGG